MTEEVRFAIVGGGIYGCSLALALRSLGHPVVILEREPDIMQRASLANQARVHTGFHYPRSFKTAARSLALHQRFAQDFPTAIHDDFQMLYAVPKLGSRVSAQRFFRTFKDISAPIELASRHHHALFDRAYIEDVFAVREYAFNSVALAACLRERLHRAGIDLRLNVDVAAIRPSETRMSVELRDGSEVRADYVFNVTYGMLNSVLERSGKKKVDLKHELVEIALVDVPDEIRNLGVTVMDGPFFSIMPFPSQDLHSLTHVQYTPYFSWTDGQLSDSPYEILQRIPRRSRWRHMRDDAAKYMPSVAEIDWRRSLFEVKTVLAQAERDDGRPILVSRAPDLPNFVSVLGGKIDNIYDLFDVVPGIININEPLDLSLLVH